MTETVSHVALKQLNHTEANMPFKALRGVHFTTGKNNCLIIHAPSIALTNPLPTTDVVELLDAHSFNWLGRHDFVINSGGIKIHPEAVENKLLHAIQSQPSLQRAINFFIFGQADAALGERLCLLVEGEQDDFDWPTLFNHLNKYERPKQVYYLPKFIRTASNKLNRQKTIALLTTD